MSAEIILRPWQIQDAGELASIANNRKIWLNVRDRFPYPYTVNDALEWIAMNEKQPTVQNFAVVYKNKVAGSVGVLTKEDVYRKSIEIGYFIGEQYWRKGIATAAVDLLLQHISQNFDVVRIFAEVFEHNKASMKVLEKNGFHLEGIREKAVIKNNILMNDYVWVKLLH